MNRTSLAWALLWLGLLPGIAAAAPSATITALAGPASANAGESYGTVTYTVANQGDAATPNTPVHFFLSTSPSPSVGSLKTAYANSSNPQPGADTYFLVSRLLSPLEAGQSSSGSLTVSWIPNWLSGTYYLTAMTDFWYLTQELTNVATMAAPVVVAGPFIADLLVTALSAPATMNAGQQYTISGTTANASTATGTARNYDVGLYLSTDDLLSPDDTYLEVLAPGPLSPGQSVTSSNLITIPNAIAGGTYRLIAKADRLGSVFELNKQNNIFVMPDPVVINGPFIPDLAVTALSGPATASAGDPYQFSYTVANLSSLAPANNVHVGVYLSTDATLSTDDLKLVDAGIGTLAPSGVYTQNNLQVVLPTSLGGTYRLIAMVDPGSNLLGSIAEANENNNVLVMADPVIVDGPHLPDLQVATVSGLTAASVGQPYTIQWSVTNSGEWPLNGTFFINFYLTQNTATLASQSPVAWASGSQVGAGATRTGTATVAQVPALLNGTYQLAAKVRCATGITESDTNNNTLVGNSVLMGADNSCPLGIPAGTPCSDGNACNGEEVCDGLGSCLAGTPPVIDDGNPCTIDSCDPVLGVIHAPAPAGTSCLDGNACNGEETCDSAGHCLAGTPPPLDDGNVCTNDSCVPDAGVVHSAMAGCSVLPPDATTGMTLFDSAAATAIAGTFHGGSNANQTGVADGTIDPQRLAIVRGQVNGRDGQALGGVTITVLGHSEYGQTLTRADGLFDLVVNGDGWLILNYQLNGSPPAQRPVFAGDHEYLWADEVVLVPYDSQVTAVTLGATTAQAARGSQVTDERGMRQATLLFPPGTQASLVLPDATQQVLHEAIHVRATEFNVYADGFEVLPGALPAANADTYCVELSLDEAVAARAGRVQFSQPVALYVEDFLGSAVGSALPVAYYDRAQAAWVTESAGRAIGILSVSNGAADLDVDGTGVAATATQLEALGISGGERQQLAALYPPNTWLWRVALTHFTPVAIGVPLASVAVSALSGPPQAVAGEPYTFEWSITNSSQWPSNGSVYVDFYLTQDSTTLGVQSPVVEIVEDALGAGETRSGTATAPQVPVLLSGTYQLVAQIQGDGVDPNSSILVANSVLIGVDALPPVVTVESPVNGRLISATSIELVVAASDDFAIQAVTANGAALTLGSDGLWHATVALSEGDNTFDVMVIDFGGHETHRSVTVRRDTTPPDLVITGPADGSETSLNTVSVTGKVTDASAVFLTMSGTRVTVDSGGNFAHSLALQPGDNTIDVVAIDAAGNRTTRSLHIHCTSTALTLVVSQPSPGFGIATASITVQGSVSGGTLPISVSVNGIVAAVHGDGSFAVSVGAPVGLVSLVVQATDGAGTTRQLSLSGWRSASSSSSGSGASSVPSVIVLTYDPIGNLTGVSNTANDPLNCGVVGNACGSTADTTAACRDGICGVMAGGQFVPLADDPNNCGAIGRVCSGTANGFPACDNGECTVQCAPGYLRRGMSCVNLLSDPMNCGSAGHTCPQAAHSTATCVDAACGVICESGYALSNGTCIDIQTDPANCRYVGYACPQPANGAATCVAGTCGISCSAGYVASNGACVNLSTDPTNCGVLGHACPGAAAGTAVCNNGTCGCQPGYIAGNGSCVDVTSDPRNCGVPGNVCPGAANGTATCSAGVCGKLSGAPDVETVNGVVPPGLQFRTPTSGGLVLTGTNLDLVTYIEFEEWGADTSDGSLLGPQSDPVFDGWIAPTQDGGPQIQFSHTATTLEIDKVALQEQWTAYEIYWLWWYKPRLHYLDNGVDRSVLVDVAVSFNNGGPISQVPPQISSVGLVRTLCVGGYYAASGCIQGSYVTGYDAASGCIQGSYVSGKAPVAVLSPDMATEYPVVSTSSEEVCTTPDLPDSQVLTPPPSHGEGASSLMLVYSYTNAADDIVALATDGIILRGTGLFNDGVLVLASSPGVAVPGDMSSVLFFGNKIVIPRITGATERLAYVEFDSMRGNVTTPWPLKWLGAPTTECIQRGPSLEPCTSANSLTYPVFGEIMTITGAWFSTVISMGFYQVYGTNPPSETLSAGVGTPGDDQYVIVDDKHIQVMLAEVPLGLDPVPRGLASWWIPPPYFSGGLWFVGAERYPGTRLLCASSAEDGQCAWLTAVPPGAPAILSGNILGSGYVYEGFVNSGDLGAVSSAAGETVVLKTQGFDPGGDILSIAVYSTDSGTMQEVYYSVIDSSHILLIDSDDRPIPAGLDAITIWLSDGTELWTPFGFDYVRPSPPPPPTPPSPQPNPNPPRPPPCPPIPICDITNNICPP